MVNEEWMKKVKDLMDYEEMEKMKEKVETVKERSETKRCLSIEDLELPYDTILNPAHYTKGRKYEPRKVIEDWDLGFNLGNAIKYISRAGRKGNAIEDLNKAIQYIRFEIERLGE